ncbi:MAG: RnfABCDGE type electron transport complex subunit D [Gammaproteobacteria bacterium]|nr:RnfABCDGE type electron transport complex subunit D [Gammaproteobacteria bacterium]
MLPVKKVQPLVEIRTSPHIHHSHSVPQIMLNVVYALLPLVLFWVFQYGISALLLLLVVVGTTLLSERFFARMAGRQSPLNDHSALITGILLALTLPPGFPLWMGAIAAFVAIALGKAIFGGLGYNLFNPALVGRAFVQAAFPVAITSWTPAYLPGRFLEFIPSTLALPLMRPADSSTWIAELGQRSEITDALTSATPLAAWKFAGDSGDHWQLLLSLTSGASGQMPGLLIIFCALYLIARNMMNWRIPVAVLGGAFITALPLYLYDSSRFADPLFVLLTGGLLLGALFMASDMVGSPVTPRGILIYGLVIGFVTVIIRSFGALPEGVMYAILLGNALAPLIESVTQPRVYGVGVTTLSALKKPPATATTPEQRHE